MNTNSAGPSPFLFDLKGTLSSISRRFSSLPGVVTLTSAFRTQKRQVIVVSLVVVGCIVFVGINAFAYLMGRKASEGKFVQYRTGKVALPVPTPTPRPLLSKGMYEFSVSSKGDKSPGFVSGSFGPVDADKPSRQTLIINFGKPDVKKVTATLISDTKKTPYVLAADPDDKRSWGVSWTLSDTHDYIYTVSIDAEDESGAKNNLTLTYR